MGSSRIEELSPRVRDCLWGVHRGLTSKEIALELGIAEGTVTGYIRDGVALLGAPNRRAAARAVFGDPVAPDPNNLGGQSLGLGEAPVAAPSEAQSGGASRWAGFADVANRGIPMTLASSNASASFSPSRSASSAASASSRLRSVPSPTSSADTSAEHDSTRDLTLRIREYEAQIRATHRAGLAVGAAFWDAQAALRLAPTTGYSVLRELDEAQRGLSDAMAAAATAHVGLKRVARRAGVDVVAYGEGTAEQEEEERRRRG